MSEPRSAPYVYVTWLTKLLAGENNCHFAAWFKAHNKYDKEPSDFNLTQWTIDHNQMLEARAIKLREEGYTVTVEGQNAFNLVGESGITLAGKPDIVAIRGGRALVIDCKTGQERHSDKAQVLLYMLILPFTHDGCKDIPIDGEVQYKNKHVKVKAEEVNERFKTQLKDSVDSIGGTKPLDKTPSGSECRYCDITKADCPQRMDASAKKTKTSLFS